MTAIWVERARAVADAMARVSDAESWHLPEPELLDTVGKILLRLAARTDLFPAGHFPPGTALDGGMYRLSEDPDLRFALYVSSEMPGFKSKVHDHTTWAVIAGIQGCEHNDIYARTDDGSKAGWGTLQPDGGMDVTAGKVCRLGHRAFHAIAITGTGQAIHLHLYGRSLEHLPERVYCELPSGGALRPITSDLAITAPMIPADEFAIFKRSGVSFEVLKVAADGSTAKPRSGADTVILDGAEGPCRIAALRLMHAGVRNLSILAS